MMKHFINSSAADFVSKSPGSTFWTVVVIIGFVLRVILEMTDPKNGWNREDD